MRLIDADALMDDIKRDTKKAIDEGDKAGSFWFGYAAGSVIAQPTIQPEKAQLSQEGTTSDLISKFIDGLEEIFADLRERHVDDSVCGLCEYDGAYMGQSGDWCNECPGFDRDDCFKLSDETRKKWTDEIIKALSTIQPEPHEGTWVYGEDSTADCVDGYRCSQCGFFVPWDYNHKLIDYINDYAYCPHCGAKMINK